MCRETQTTNQDNLLPIKSHVIIFLSNGLIFCVERNPFAMHMQPFFILLYKRTQTLAYFTYLFHVAGDYGLRLSSECIPLILFNQLNQGPMIVLVS